MKTSILYITYTVGNTRKEEDFKAATRVQIRGHKRFTMNPIANKSAEGTVVLTFSSISHIKK